MRATLGAEHVVHCTHRFLLFLHNTCLPTHKHTQNTRRRKHASTEQTASEQQCTLELSTLPSKSPTSRKPLRRPQVSRRVVLGRTGTHRDVHEFVARRKKEKRGWCIGLLNSRTFLFAIKKKKRYRFLFRGSKQNKHLRINVNNEAGCAPRRCKAKPSQDKSSKDRFFSSGSGQRALAQKLRRSQPDVYLNRVSY